MEKNNWDDKVINGAEYVKLFLDFVMKERSQLYGTIILLMLKLGETEIAMPEIEAFREFGNKYYVLFSGEDENFKVEIKEREAPVEQEILD